LVAKAQALDGLEVDLDAAARQFLLQPLADFERAAPSAARHEFFGPHVHAERERGSRRKAFRPGSQCCLHSTRAPDSLMARPHFATSDSRNAPNSCGVELIA